MFVNFVLFSVMCQPVIYHDIYINEPIVTKSYVWQNYVDGKKRYVPLINGYIPEVYETFYPEYSYYIFDYRKKIIYRPKPPNLAPVPKLPTIELLPPLEDDGSEQFKEPPSSVH